MLPDAAVMADFCAKAVGTDERVREPPGAPGELAEGLCEPACQREVIPFTKHARIFQPERIQRIAGRFGFKCHCEIMARKKLFVERMEISAVSEIDSGNKAAANCAFRFT